MSHYSAAGSEDVDTVWYLLEYRRSGIAKLVRLALQRSSPATARATAVARCQKFYAQRVGQELIYGPLPRMGQHR